MIFKKLNARRVKKLFGEHIPESEIDEIVDSMTEWQAFKGLLPRALMPTAMTDQKAREEVSRAIEQALKSRSRKLT